MEGSARGLELSVCFHVLTHVCVSVFRCTGVSPVEAVAGCMCHISFVCGLAQAIVVTAVRIQT